MAFLAEVQDRLEHLVCPVCKGPLYLETLPRSSLGCVRCAVLYRLEGTIPVLLRGEAMAKIVERPRV